MRNKDVGKYKIKNRVGDTADGQTGQKTRSEKDRKGQREEQRVIISNANDPGKVPDDFYEGANHID